MGLLTIRSPFIIIRPGYFPGEDLTLGDGPFEISMHVG